MSKKYYLLIAFLVILVTVVIATRKPEAPQTALLDRTAGLSSLAEWTNTKNAINELQLKLKQHPSSVKDKMMLIQAFIQEGRITGNHAYYDAIAFKLVNEILNDDPENFEALCSKATLQASAHQFSEALITAEKAIKVNPYNAYIYGVKCDALTELGKYTEAETAANKMVSIRPDIRSYARVSYLREIYGYYDGAIEAMKMALSSGSPGTEQTEWVRVQLGNLYRKIGKINEAELQYKTSLYHRPVFAPAVAGIADLFRMKNENDSALKYYLKAADVVSDYAYYMNAGIISKQMGDSVNSTAYLNKAEEILIKHSHSTDEENGVGHYVDRELSQVYIAAGKYKEAYAAARMEYLRRPANIDVDETLAWAAYKNGSYEEAKFHISSALKTNSKDAELLYKTSLILKKNKLPLVSQEWLNNARSINPYVDNYFHIPGSVTEVALR